MKRIMFLQFLLFAAVFSAYSFKFEPISRDFDPSGQGSIQSFRIENNGLEPIAIKIFMLTREMLSDGSEVNTPADDKFLVFPSRIVLNPGARQVVRVQWKGNPDPDKELPFRIVAEELPVDFSRDEPTSGIRVMFRYIGSVYILPEGTSPGIEILSVKRIPASEQNGLENLQLEVQNSGDAHVIMGDLKVVLNHESGDSVIIESDLLPGINGENILAGVRRIFTMSLPRDFPEGEVDAVFDFKVLR